MTTSRLFLMASLLLAALPASAGQLWASHAVAALIQSDDDAIDLGDLPDGDLDLPDGDVDIEAEEEEELELEEPDEEPSASEEEAWDEGAETEEPVDEEPALDSRKKRRPLLVDDDESVDDEPEAKPRSRLDEAEPGMDPATMAYIGAGAGAAALAVATIIIVPSVLVAGDAAGWWQLPIDFPWRQQKETVKIRTR